MKKFDIITIFPKLFDGFLSESLLARAQKKKLLSIKTHNLRDWTTDNHKTVDGRPYGGGAGMVLMIEPIYKAVKTLQESFDGDLSRTIRALKKRESFGRLRTDNKTRIVLLSAKGKTFTQKDARRLLKYDQVVFICGRYEGVDERVADYIADEEISIGNYVLFGGEVAAMVIIEAVSRLIPGVVAKSESVINESFSDKDVSVREHPQYTRPEVFRMKTRIKNKESRIKELKVPPVLLTGNHAKINDWRKKKAR